MMWPFNRRKDYSKKQKYLKWIECFEFNDDGSNVKDYYDFNISILNLCGDEEVIDKLIRRTAALKFEEYMSRGQSRVIEKLRSDVDKMKRMNDESKVQE